MAILWAGWREFVWTENRLFADVWCPAVWLSASVSLGSTRGECSCRDAADSGLCAELFGHFADVYTVLQSTLMLLMVRRDLSGLCSQIAFAFLCVVVLLFLAIRSLVPMWIRKCSTPWNLWFTSFLFPLFTSGAGLQSSNTVQAEGFDLGKMLLIWVRYKNVCACQDVYFQGWRDCEFLKYAWVFLIGWGDDWERQDLME